MSLTIAVYVLNPETGVLEDDIPLDEGGEQGNRTLAGFERCRSELWGSLAVRSLGCYLLPSLASHDLYASGEDLMHLAHECEMILEHLGQVAARTGYAEEYIEFRTGNIRDAVRIARTVQHSVVVVW